MTTKVTKERVLEALSEHREEIAKLPTKSKTSRARQHLWQRNVMLALRYPKFMPPEFLEELAHGLVDSDHTGLDTDENVEFVLEFFPDLKAAKDAESEHAIQWAEGTPPPKPDKNKKK